jgi:hypothetical protein
VSEIRRKGARWHITCDVDIYDRNDAIALRTRTTQTFLVDTGFEGLVRAPDAPRGPRPVDAATAAADAAASALTSLRKFVTEEMCVRFFGGTQNYHTNADEAKKMGFGGIVVGGPMSVCFIGQMLALNLGLDLLTGSDLDIRFVDILWPNEQIEVRGRRAPDPIAEFDRNRYPFNVQVCDQSGRSTVVASGSSVVGGVQV